LRARTACGFARLSGPVRLHFSPPFVATPDWGVHPLKRRKHTIDCEAAVMRYVKDKNKDAIHYRRYRPTNGAIRRNGNAAAYRACRRS
jgi:hypothetical protein